MLFGKKHKFILGSPKKIKIRKESHFSDKRLLNLFKRTKKF